MDRKKLAKELLAIVKELIAVEFDSEEALKKYLKEHPDADKSKHSVRKKKKVERRPPTPMEMNTVFSDVGDAVEKQLKGKGFKKEEDLRDFVYEELITHPKFSIAPRKLDLLSERLVNRLKGEHNLKF